MKHFNLFLVTIVLILASCTSESEFSNSNSPDFKTIKTLVWNSTEYVEYKNSLDGFFQHIENRDYNIIEVYNQIKKSGIAFDCSIEIPKEISKIDGALIYWNSKCDYENKLVILLNTHPDIKNLTRYEYSEILNGPELKNSKREIDCLTQFQNEWNGDGGVYDEESGYWDVNDSYQDDAVYNYDKCCDNGGSGCP